jgi:hypothetical protein
MLFDAVEELRADLVSEFDTIDLRDKRLNKRAKLILQSFAEDPQGNPNKAWHGWAETQAGFRFLDNDHVDPEAILAPHRTATLARVARQSIVLIVQDTTELDLSAHPPDGAGPLRSKKTLGCLDHSQVAFTPTGLCLGVVGVKLWSRSEEGLGGSKKRRHDPIETKESYRWLEGYRNACEIARQAPETQVVSVADREGDLYEVFVEASAMAEEARQSGEKAAEFVIRLGKNRNLASPKEDEAGLNKLFQTLHATEPIGLFELELPATPRRKPRVARLEILRQRMRLKTPRRPREVLPDVEINAVLVREIDAPPDVAPIQWLLATSLPIDTKEDVLRVTEYYAGRWPIEIFFRILKTGCRVERIELQTAERFARCLMFYKIVAWRLQFLTILGRECPQLPCDVMFDEDEWKPVWKICKPKKPMPKTAPPLGEFLLLVASLGGHNGRKGDGPPGPQTLWSGLQRMADFTLAWKAFQLQQKRTGDTCV